MIINVVAVAALEAEAVFFRTVDGWTSVIGETLGIRVPETYLIFQRLK
jgi:hypothetical protein